MNDVIAFFTHRILLDKRKSDYSDHQDPTYDEFRDFLIDLKKTRRFVSSDELAERVREGVSLEGLAHVSLDDGFASTVLAAEICTDLDIPLTVFVLSGTLEGYVPWFVLRTAAVASHGGTVSFRGQRYDTRDIDRAVALHNVLKEHVYAVPSESQRQVLFELLDECRMSIPALPEKFRFLNEKELLGLADAGVEIGCHGRTHCTLPGETKAVLDREIADSRSALEAVVGRPVCFFSYPDGSHDEIARRRVESCGFRAAFSVVEQNAPYRLTALPRMSFGRFRNRITEGGR